MSVSDNSEPEGIFYTIEFLDAAKRDIKSLSKKVQAQVIERIEKLAFDPRPHGMEPLTKFKGLIRIRSGNYRIVYKVEDDVLTVLVVAIGDRKEIYETVERRAS